MKAQRRWLGASSVALILALTMLSPSATEGRIGGGFDCGGHGFGCMDSTGARSLTVPPALAPGVAVAPFSLSMSERQTRARAQRFVRAHRVIGPHVLILGDNGIWIDHRVYPPMVLPQARPVTAAPRPLNRRLESVKSESVKSPAAVRPGIMIVRGDSRGYVVF